MRPWRIDDCSEEQRRRINEALLRDDVAGPASDSKRSRSTPLVRQAPYKTGMVNIPGPVHVRIIRRFPGTCNKEEYDDDNLSGGNKRLRDAIAAFLGLKGDSHKDGITFAYAQEQGEVPQTIIEFYTCAANDS